MRMAELSAESGVPVATIKYYLREGLLPPGERTSPNQARYDRQHVRRLKLVRALLDVGGLSIAGVREVLAGIDEQADIHQVLGTTQRGLALQRGQVDGPTRDWAMSLSWPTGWPNWTWPGCAGWPTARPWWRRPWSAPCWATHCSRRCAGSRRSAPRPARSPVRPCQARAPRTDGYSWRSRAAS
jgi:DNA-binding transcriptional MerR regulator